jgi:hypothetical protein
MDAQFYVDSRAPHLSADIASVTLATTLKAMAPVSNIPVLGSNYFGYVGKAMRITMFGRMTTGATPGNGQLALLWGNGTDANGTTLAQSAAFALSASQTNLSWQAQFIARCRAIGASGALMVTGSMEGNPSLIASTLQTIMIPASAPAQTSVDLTQAFVLSPQFSRSGSTAETLQVHELFYESLN